MEFFYKKIYSICSFFYHTHEAESMELLGIQQSLLFQIQKLRLCA